MAAGSKPLVVREGAVQCIQCSNLVLETINNTTATRYEHWSGTFPRYGRCLRVFGELGIVHVKSTTTKKLDNRGKRCFFLGNSLPHPPNTFRMFDPNTGRVNVTQDVVWMNKMFYREDYEPTTEADHQQDITLTGMMELLSIHQNYEPDPEEQQEPEQHEDESSDTDDDATIPDLIQREPVELDPPKDTETNDDLSTGTPPIHEDNDLSFSTPAPMPVVHVSSSSTSSSVEGDVSALFQDEEANWHTVTSKGRKVRTPSRFRESAAPAVESNIYAALSDSEDDDADTAFYVPLPITSPDVAAVGAGTLHNTISHTDRLKTMTYKEAMATDQVKEWEHAVFEEYMRFAKREALEIVPKEKVPKNAKFISTVWAMKQKADGTFRARLNMRGYEQIRGVHYDPAWTSAPVAGATTIRIMLVLMLMSGNYAHIVDVNFKTTKKYTQQFLSVGLTFFL